MSPGSKNYAVFGHGEPGYTLDNLSVENNIFYKNGIDSVGFYQIVPTNKTLQNNFSGDPSFVAAHDFHLSPGSPAMDWMWAYPTISAACFVNNRWQSRGFVNKRF